MTVTMIRRCGESLLYSDIGGHKAVGPVLSSCSFANSCSHIMAPSRQQGNADLHWHSAASSSTPTTLYDTQQTQSDLPIEPAYTYSEMPNNTGPHHFSVTVTPHLTLDDPAGNDTCGWGVLTTPSDPADAPYSEVVHSIVEEYVKDRATAMHANPEYQGEVYNYREAMDECARRVEWPSITGSSGVHIDSLALWRAQNKLKNARTHVVGGLLTLLRGGAMGLESDLDRAFADPEGWSIGPHFKVTFEGEQ